MADISTYINAISSAKGGETVRDSIIDAINAINNGANNALLLNGKSPDDYVTTEYAVQELAKKQDALTFDEKPTKDSKNPVTSDGVYQAVKDIGSALDAINGESR